MSGKADQAHSSSTRDRHLRTVQWPALAAAPHRPSHGRPRTLILGKLPAASPRTTKRVPSSASSSSSTRLGARYGIEAGRPTRRARQLTGARQGISGRPCTPHLTHCPTREIISSGGPRRRCTFGTCVTSQAPGVLRGSVSAPGVCLLGWMGADCFRRNCWWRRSTSVSSRRRSWEARIRTSRSSCPRSPTIWMSSGASSARTTSGAGRCSVAAASG